MSTGHFDFEAFCRTNKGYLLVCSRHKFRGRGYPVATNVDRLFPVDGRYADSHGYRQDDSGHCGTLSFVCLPMTADHRLPVHSSGQRLIHRSHYLAVRFTLFFAVGRCWRWFSRSLRYLLRLMEKRRLTSGARQKNTSLDGGIHPFGCNHPLC